jgi:protein SCO1
MFINVLLIIFSLSFLHAYQPSTEGGAQNEMPQAIEGVGIDEKLNTNLPGDVVLKDDQGRTVKLSDYFNESKPVILSLVYYSCPSLCNLHLKGVFEVFKELGLKPKEDFEFLAVSFDPKENSDLALAKKETYITEFLKENESAKEGIHFLTADQENISKLAKAVGFKYKWNAEANEWAHASAAIISTPQGLISRYLHGVYFEPQTFRLSVVEASQGKVGHFADNFALFCFRYDPKENKYAFYIMNILRVVAGIVLLLLMAWLLPFWYKSVKSNG